MACALATRAETGTLRGASSSRKSAGSSCAPWCGSSCGHRRARAPAGRNRGGRRLSGIVAAVCDRGASASSSRSCSTCIAIASAVRPRPSASSAGGSASASDPAARDASPVADIVDGNRSRRPSRPLRRFLLPALLGRAGLRFARQHVRVSRRDSRTSAAVRWPGESGSARHPRTPAASPACSGSSSNSRRCVLRRRGIRRRRRTGNSAIGALVPSRRSRPPPARHVESARP